MSLRTIAETIPNAGVTKPKCSIGALMTNLDADDQAWLEAELAGNRPGTWIVKVLKADGHEVSSHNLQRHRRGECKCP